MLDSYSRPGFYVGDDSEDGSDGGSLMVEGIGLDDSYPATTKSQVSIIHISN